MSVSKSNPQVADAVSQVNSMIVGMAPAMAMGSLYQNLAYSTSIAAMNAVYAQQQTFIMQQAATAQSVAMLLSSFGK